MHLSSMTDGVLPPASTTGHWTEARIIAPPDLIEDVRPEPTGGYLAICLIVKVRLMMWQGTGSGLLQTAYVTDLRCASACCPAWSVCCMPAASSWRGHYPAFGHFPPLGAVTHMSGWSLSEVAQALQQQLRLPWYNAALQEPLRTSLCDEAWELQAWVGQSACCADALAWGADSNLCNLQTPGLWSRGCAVACRTSKQHHVIKVTLLQL